MRTEYHPKLNIFVREDGCIFLPQNYHRPAHWTYGCKRKDGYCCVRIAGKLYFVHRLIAEAFFGEIPDGYEVDHINRNKGDNSVENLRIVTRCENQRNTSAHDRVEEQGRTHLYEDAKKAMREYYATNREKVRDRQARYSKDKRNTHKYVHFSDGSSHWIPLPEAEAYLIIPLKERHYGR